MSSAMAEQGLLQKLFRENNELRIKVHNLHRELFNKNLQIESVEEELRNIKSQFDDREKFPGQDSKQSSDKSKEGGASHKRAALLQDDNNTNNALLETINSKNNEIQDLSEEVEKLKQMLEQKESQIQQLNTNVEMLNADVKQLQDELEKIENGDEESVDDEPPPQTQESPESQLDPEKLQEDLDEARKSLKTAQDNLELLRKQSVIYANEANKKNNDLQNQLQGVESLVEGLKREYDEFLEISKLENEAARAIQQQEYDRLRHEFDLAKIQHHQEKHKLLAEFRSLLFSMQSQFEEYKTTSEFIFNIEISKLEDEIANQAQRFEHELIYTVQAKDKFYAEMMVSKDAKIMNLIEGSDLQTVLQKQEADIEALRKDHAKEIARMKDERDSEQKNLIAGLQKQNAAMEAKFDKVQSQAKSLETKVKELTNNLESKTRLLHEKDEAQSKLEADMQSKVDAANARVLKLIQEKEHLRHKIIRMSMDAKGEGENNIDNMVKRLARETHDLHKEYDNLSSKHKVSSEECEMLRRRVKEKDRFVSFLEKEVQRRNEEIDNLTKTFERFLLSRTSQLRKERKEKMKQQQTNLEEMLKEARQKIVFETSAKEGPSAANQQLAMLDPNRLPELRAKVRFNLPKTLRAENTSDMVIERETLQNELNQGLTYLKRFKAISKVFALSNMQRYMALAAVDPSIEGGAISSSTSTTADRYKKLNKPMSDVPDKLVTDPAILEAVNEHYIGTKVIEVTSGAGYGSNGAGQESSKSTIAVNQDNSKASKKTYIINSRGEKVSSTATGKGIYVPPPKGTRESTLRQHQIQRDLNNLTLYSPGGGADDATSASHANSSATGHGTISGMMIGGTGQSKASANNESSSLQNRKKGQ